MKCDCGAPSYCLEDGYCWDCDPCVIAADLPGDWDEAEVQAVVEDAAKSTR